MFIRFFFVIMAFLLSPCISFSQPVIPPPVQTDEIIIDAGTTGAADPADRIRYRVTIQNTGTANGNGTQLNIVPDPRTTFVAGSFRSSPLALPEAYDVTGNVGINVAAGSGLKANDFDDNIAGATITAGTFTTVQNGSIMINADGSFMYTPPAGFTGTDTYTYTLNDGNGVGGGVPATDPGLVTFMVSNLIWFIDNSSMAGTSDGRLSSPFKSVSDFNAGSATAAAVVYLEHTGTNYTGPVTLQANERLFGEGHTGAANLSGVLPFTLATHSKTLPNINGTRPVITNGSGHGVVVASGNTVRGLDVGNTTGGYAIKNTGATSVGNLTISEVSVSGTGGIVDIPNGGTLAISFGTLSSTGHNAAFININGAGGTFMAGATTLTTNTTGDGVNLTNCSAAFTFASFDLDNIFSDGIELNGNTTGSFTVTGLTDINGTGTGGIGVNIQNSRTYTFGNVTVNNRGSSGVFINANTGGQQAGQFGTVTINNQNTSATTALGIDNAVTAGGVITISSVAINNNGSNSSAIALSNNDGANISINGGSVQGAAGAAVSISSSAGTATYAGSITNTAGLSVQVLNNQAGSTTTLSGNITDTGAGINVSNNTGGTVTFSGTSKSLTTTTNTAVNVTTNTGATINFTGGGLVINTTSGLGFNATGGGTISVQGTGNRINNTTGPANTNSATALNVVSTTIGASGLTFQSIACGNTTATADPANGIVLNSTGASGGLTVVGDGGGSNNGSGGTIQNTTGSGISLTNAINVSLSYVNIQNSGDDGISGTSITGFTMHRSNVTNNGNALNEDGVDFGGSGVISPNGLYGTVTVTNSVFTGNYYNQFTIRNSINTVNMTMTGCTITGRAAENNNNDGLFYEALGTSTITGNIQNCTFSANKGDHFQAAATNSGDLNITFKANTLTGGHSSALGQGITINAALGVAFGGYSGNVVYDVDGNTINGAISNGVSIVQGTSSAAATFTGFVRNNSIGTSGVSLSGSTQANGVYIDSRGNGTHTSSVTGNTLRQCFDRGILLEAGDGDAVANLTIQSNIIDQQVDVNAREAIQTNFGITSTNVFGNVDSPVVCLQLGGAGSLANTFSHGGGAPDDFRLRKRFEATVRLPGYAGGTGQDATSLAQVVAFIQGQNTGSAGEPGSAAASGTGGGYIGGAACNLP